MRNILLIIQRGSGVVSSKKFGFKYRVLAWAKQRGILSEGTKLGQFKKTCEEVHELSLAINCNDFVEVKDAIGDITVTLVILAEMYGLDFDDCCEYAYDIISKRKGVMEDGQFVKEHGSE